MAAATANLSNEVSATLPVVYPVAADTVIYSGTLVGTNATGYLVAMSDAASLTFRGVAVDNIVNTGGAAGILSCRVRRTGVFEFEYAGGDATTALLGSRVYAQDNQTVDEDVTLTTNDYAVGRIVAVKSVRIVTVDIGSALVLDEALIQYTTVSIAAAAIIDLADTPVTLVAAPGAGKYLELVSAVLFLDHAGTGFAESADNLEIHYENEAGAAATGVIEMTGFINQTADTLLHVLPLSPVARAKTAVENKALVLTNIDGDFTDAGTTTSVLRVRTAYRVHATGW